MELGKKFRLTDVGALLRKWNNMASKSAQLLGGKSQSVKNIMELLPQGARQKIMDITLKYSWEQGPWHEDQLASKKIYPGHQPRGGPKSWNDRKRITKESCELMVDCINNAYENAAPRMRRKPTRAEVEEHAILAAVVWSLGKEVQSTIPISDEVIKLEWLDKYSAGDARISTEVQVVQSEASEKFHVRDVPTLNALMGVHNKQTPMSSSPHLSVASDGDQMVLSRPNSSCSCNKWNTTCKPSLSLIRR